MKSKPSKNNNGPGPAQPTPELISRAQIEKRAHEIWLAAGCPHGDDLSHWLEAEREAQKGPTGEAGRERPSISAR